MQSSNPVFARSEGFNGRSAGPAPSTYSDPSTWSTGAAGAPAGYDTGYGHGAPTAPVDQGRMTIDSVVQKSAFTLGTVVLFGALTWFWLTPVTEATWPRTVGVAFGGLLVGFVLAMVNIFKKQVSPGLVLAYAAVEGVALGAISLVIPISFGNVVPSGVVFQAVLGTMIVVAATLVVYKSGAVKVTDKFRRGVMIAGLAAVGLMLVNLVLALFGVSTGLRGDGALGIGFGLLMVVLGALFLVLDFDEIENGIRSGLPEVESWRSAFGLTVTIVWIYIEILRLVSIFSSDN